MDIILLGITIVSLVVALVMSVTAWRLMRDDKQRSAARVAALSVAASASDPVAGFVREAETPKPIAKAPWSPPRIVPTPVIPTAVAPAVELPLNQPARVEPVRVI